MSSDSIIPSGFVFRENKFSMEPTLPFDSLAIPGFQNVDNDK